MYTKPEYLPRQARDKHEEMLKKRCVFVAGMSDGGSFVNNEKVGLLCGALCHTSYSSWKAGHLYHHRHSNNLTHSQVTQLVLSTASSKQQMMDHVSSRVGLRIGLVLATCWPRCQRVGTCSGAAKR
eukprot:COSAG06_NODE_3715_length_4984_cov_3.899284_5_plen_126_part_00